MEEDIAGIEEALEKLSPAPRTAEPKQQPRRQSLPEELPRTIIRHEPEHTDCDCGCPMESIGEDSSEKLDYIPGSFTVEQHVRVRWVYHTCEP